MKTGIEREHISLVRGKGRGKSPNSFIELGTSSSHNCLSLFVYNIVLIFNPQDLNNTWFNYGRIGWPLESAGGSWDQPSLPWCKRQRSICCPTTWQEGVCRSILSFHLSSIFALFLSNLIVDKLSLSRQCSVLLCRNWRQVWRRDLSIPSGMKS